MYNRSKQVLKRDAKFVQVYLNPPKTEDSVQEKRKEVIFRNIMTELLRRSA